MEPSNWQVYVLLIRYQKSHLFLLFNYTGCHLATISGSDTVLTHSPSIDRRLLWAELIIIGAFWWAWHFLQYLIPIAVQTPIHSTWVELATACRRRGDECRRKAASCGPHFRHQHGRDRRMRTGNHRGTTN